MPNMSDVELNPSQQMPTNGLPADHSTRRQNWQIANMGGLFHASPPVSTPQPNPHPSETHYSTGVVLGPSTPSSLAHGFGK